MTGLLGAAHKQYEKNKMSEFIKGIDVSQYQGSSLPWATIRDSGVQFVIARGGHGVTLDLTFERHIKGAHDVGLTTGLYWFFEADHDAERQSELVLELMNKLPIDMEPYIDFETLEGCSPSRALIGAEEFNEHLQNGCTEPILYTCYDFWMSKLGNPEHSSLTKLDLWVAHYGVKVPLIPKPWQKRGWVLWQYDGDGGERLPNGKDSDFVYCTNIDHLLRFSDCRMPTLETGPITSREQNMIWLNQLVGDVLEENRRLRDKRLREREDLARLVPKLV